MINLIRSRSAMFSKQPLKLSLTFQVKDLLYSGTVLSTFVNLPDPRDQYDQRSCS